MQLIIIRRRRRQTDERESEIQNSICNQNAVLLQFAQQQKEQAGRGEEEKIFSQEIPRLCVVVVRSGARNHGRPSPRMGFWPLLTKGAEGPRRCLPVPFGPIEYHLSAGLPAMYSTTV